MHKTLPRHFYADPDFYKSELERLYFARWICAGRAGQIPNAGDFFTRTLADESLVITRDGTGAINALFNVCRHQAGISSRVYEPGPYSEREELLWRFDEIIRNDVQRRTR
jgi:Rieske [2Fe-2S] domain